MGLRIKILAGFLILTLMLAIAGIWSIYELRATGFSVQAILDENIRSIHAAADMTEALEREDSAILLLLLGKWSDGRAMLSAADSLFNDRLNFAYTNITLPGEKAYLDTISQRYQAYKKLWERPIVDTPKEGNIEWYFNKIHIAFLSVKDGVEDLNNINNTAMYTVASDTKQRSKRAVMPGLIAILAALVFTFIFNYFVHYFMVSPIIRITERIEKFISSKKPYDVKIESHDELAKLSESISHLCEFVQSKDRSK